MRDVVDGILRMIINGSAGGYEFNVVSASALEYEKMVAQDKAELLLENPTAEMDLFPHLLLVAARIRRLTYDAPSELFHSLYGRILKRLKNQFGFDFPAQVEESQNVTTDNPENLDGVLELFASESDRGLEETLAESTRKEHLPVEGSTYGAADHSKKVCFKCLQVGHIKPLCPNLRVRPSKRRRDELPDAGKVAGATKLPTRDARCHRH